MGNESHKQIQRTLTSKEGMRWSMQQFDRRGFEPDLLNLWSISVKNGVADPFHFDLDPRFR